MKTAVKYSLLALLLSVVTFGMAVAMHRCNVIRADQCCRKVIVEPLENYSFIDTAEVRRMLERECIGLPLDSIDLDGIEKGLECRSVILKSEAWTTSKDRALHIDLQQRKPVVLCKRGESGFYIDNTGYVFPSRKSYKAEVRTIEGNIPGIEDGTRSQWVSGVLELVNYINSSREWSRRVERISVDGNGDLGIRLTGCDVLFIFGSPREYGDKFRKIEEYFEWIEPSKEKGYYKTVNLKYKKQLICQKGI